MALAVWRSSVPSRPERRGWGVSQPHTPADVTEFEDGPDRMRDRGGPVTLRWSRQLRASEFVEFEDMVRLDFKNGTARFIMPVVRPGRATSNKTCQIVGGQYTADSDSTHYRVTFTLKVWSYYS